MGLLSNFGNDVVTGFLGVNTLKDFQHASKTFTSNGYELAPKLKFLYHVYFDLNKDSIPSLYSKYDEQSQIDLGLLVKQVSLPSFQIKTDELNQYNRKRIIQTKLEYDDVSLTMHDDGANLSRNLWYDYMTYYYNDSNYNFEGQSTTDGSTRNPGFKYSERDIYSENRTVNDWGYSGDGQGLNGGSGIDSTKPYFFRSIKIFGMNKRNFVCYVLINPHITAFKHDEYNYSEGGGIMANTMTLKYEAVKYYEGTLEGKTSRAPIDGFDTNTRYDTEPSSLGTPGSSASIFGQAGLVDAGQGILSDLASGNILGAVKKAGTAYRTVSKAGLGNIIKEEGIGMVKEGLPQAVRSTAGFYLPKASNKGAANTATQPPTTPPRTII
jgi:hypothetical protein